MLQELAQQPGATPETFDFDRDLRRPRRRARPGHRRAPAPEPERGGKLILWQGWADPGVPAQLTLSLHQATCAQRRCERGRRPSTVHGARRAGLWPRHGSRSVRPKQCAAASSCTRAQPGSRTRGVGSVRSLANQVIGAHSIDALTGTAPTRASLLCANPSREGATPRRRCEQCGQLRMPTLNKLLAGTVCRDRIAS
jgi:hypothetical protein